MVTKDIVEAILYLKPDTYKNFRAAHIINDTDRNWTAKQHDEYPYINAFTNPHFLIIISKQIHVYIIGDKANNKSYNMINIEGFNADHMTLTIKNLWGEIKNSVKADVFLPDNIYERVIFIKNDDTLYIFNRINTKGNLMSKNSEWTLGVDPYTMDQPRYVTNVWEILLAIQQEIEEDEKKE